MAEDFENASTVKVKTFDGNVLLSTVEPANMQAMFATQFKDFDVGQRRYDAFSPLIGRSIFSSDGASWEHSRALFRPQFSRENINDLETTDRAAGALIDALGNTNPDGWTEESEMMPLLYNFTLDTATDFLFGKSVESQTAATTLRKQQSGKQDVGIAAKKTEAQNLADSLVLINDYLIKRIQFQSLYWLGDGFKFRKALKTVRNFTEPFVRLATDAASSHNKTEVKKQSLLRDLATQTQDRTELRNQTLAILFAGRDTTSSLLGWAVNRLALHPDVFAKLRNVILCDFPSGEDITFAKLKGCRYLQHFLSECLRLHPTVPVNQRIANKDTTLPVGGGPDQSSPIALRKGQPVLFSVYVMQRRKDLWGPDADKFRPERWEQRFQSWQFLPFLGGE